MRVPTATAGHHPIVPVRQSAYRLTHYNLYFVHSNQSHSMKASTRNAATGTANIVNGDAKQLAGKVLGKKLLQARGRAQELVGKIQKEVAKRQKRAGN